MNAFVPSASRRWLWPLAMCSWVALLGHNAAAQDHLVLLLDQVPKDGLVVAPVDLSEAARSCQLAVVPDRLRVVVEGSRTPVPAQFIPGPDQPEAGILVMRCDPASARLRLQVDFRGSAAPAPATNAQVQTPWFTVVHDPARMGGLPAEVVFAGTGGKFEPHYWNDRLYHRDAGQFYLRNDRQPKVQCLAAGPLCTVVRVAANYCGADGQPPASRPGATYDWYYFHHQPLVHVRCLVRQRAAFAWAEAHFLELGFPTNGFAHWAGGEPAEEGLFRGGDASHRFSRWGAVFDARGAIGMFAAGPVGIYDGRGYGRYLHADMDAAWRAWDTTNFTRSAWLWINAGQPPTNVLGALAAARSPPPVITVSTWSWQQRLAQLRDQFARAPLSRRPDAGWRLAAARLLEQQGRFREGLSLPAGQLPKQWSVIAAGDLRLVLESRADGLVLAGLADAGTGALLSGPAPLPLFAITLRDRSTNEIRLTAERGWRKVQLEPLSRSGEATLRWQNPLDDRLGGLTVTARIRADAARHRLAWSVSAEGQSPSWAIWRTAFPQVALSAEAPESQLVLPQVAGLLKPVGRERLARFAGDYPNGWMSMQLAALYDPAAGTGLYFGLHDPGGATKRFTAESAGEARAVRLAWDIPAPDMGQAGNRFALPGEAVWQLLRGDWFDAALIYRDWARREARWFPALTADGRADTPAWMRELPAWAMMGGAPAECVPPVREFAQALGVPIGFHWYSWHQIPFDNDYPHYFPARDGFVAGVQELQAAGVYVMPYINGRLWDTHDRGASDFEFTRVARPAAAKDARGEPYVETYGSKEATGQPVQLAVMCPTTPLWRDRQRDLVLRLFNEAGVKGVYMDQIAAASPVLCFDPAHGHPLGGGNWWAEQGYWPLLDAIRRAKPADRMLTSECNAEPFLRWFDGYLTWHWQNDGQIPLFPAVYGGAIQMFGRAYGGGPTRDLALRMRAGQQLVWGEQLGWLHPNLVREPENFAFFRAAVRLRWALRRYFYAGQMARPPGLAGDIPSVTADWRWSGVWPVTTPALLSGAWHLPAEKRLVLLFANVSAQPVSAAVTYNLGEAGFAGKALVIRQLTPDGDSALGTTPALLRQPVRLPPRSVLAWEITPGK